MAAKKNDSSDELWLTLVCAIAFIPFLIVAFRHYKKLEVRYPRTETSQRIFDTVNLMPPLSAGSTVVLFSMWLIYQVSQWALAILAVPVVALAGIWLACAMARWVASTYRGVIVDPSKGAVVLPKDFASYGISDYLSLQFVRDLGEVDVIPLSSITKLTREAGKHVYIHGPFGSRGMTFSNKQKRDECLAAIERSARGVRAVADFGY